MLISRVTLVLALMSLLAIGTAAQETAHLKGLTGIAVHVNLNGSANVSMTQLEGEIQQRLRQAGIAVVPAETPRPFGTQGHLWANITVIQSTPGSNQWFLHTQLRLYGSAVLAGSNQRAEAITWETERLLVVGTAEIDARLRGDLNFLVDDFSAAYRSANR